MAYELDREIWLKRWQALNAVIENIETLLDKQGTAEEELIKQLRPFAEGQFAFFYDGFGEQQNGIKLAKDWKRPPEHTLWMIIDQISSDIGVIERAVDQRQDLELMEVTLEWADTLAQNALQPAIGNLLNGDHKAVTYFHKLPSIRVIPYADVVPIAVPFTATLVTQDFLAIPHEVGHYVYRRGEVSQNGETRVKVYKVLGEKLDSIPDDDPVKQWTEEIFADVYSCLIAGPVVALSSQDLALQRSLAHFIGDDGVHPRPALRPLIYARVLESKGWQDTEDLKQLWIRKLETREQAIDDAQSEPCGKAEPPERDVQLQLSAKEVIQRVRAGQDGPNPTLDELDKVIEIADAALELLSGVPHFSWPDTWSGEELRLAKNGKEDTASSIQNPLYSAFEDKAKAHAPVTMEEIPAPVSEPTSPALKSEWDDWFRDQGFADNIGSGPEEVCPGFDEDIDKEPNGTWIQVLYANGWATRLPHRGGD